MGSVARAQFDNRTRVSLLHSARPDVQLLSTDGDGEVLPRYWPFVMEVLPQHKDSVMNLLQAKVLYNRGDLYLACVPVENLDSVMRLDRIIKLQKGSLMSMHMDVVRDVCGIDAIHAGRQDIPGMDGSGVVTGICDLGFDPRHPAFSQCLKRWTMVDEFNATMTVYDGYDNIRDNAPATDDVENTHATHVGNILAGSGSPYAGVAPGSHFVATTSNLSDVGILAGIESIIEYARTVNMPAVVNISAGSYLGPHDGTDLVGRYLSALAADATICFSAGNYGHRMNCRHLDLDRSYGNAALAWSDMSWTANSVDGSTDLWSDDSKPFRFRIIVKDAETGAMVYESDWLGGEAPEGHLTVNLEKTGFFTTGSSVWCAWGYADVTGRYNVAIDYDYTNAFQQNANPWGRCFVGVQLQSVEPGTQVVAYADGIHSFLHGGMGLPGDPDGSISNLACCPDVIAVGAWNSRNVVPDVDNGKVEWNHTLNTVADWSAWGTSADGRKLPLVCAPGNTVVSAMSGPYYSNLGGADIPVSLLDGARWHAMSGTSMSCPVAAGIVAIWLQADNTLKIREIQDIAATTASRDFSDIDNPRWGGGAIDAKAGLEEVYRRKSSMTDARMPDAPQVWYADGCIKYIWPCHENVTVAVYGVSGQSMSSSLSPGIYIVELRDGDTAVRAKLAVNR